MAEPAVAAGSKRWPASLKLGFEHTARRTVLRRRGAVGPLYVQRPFYPEGPIPHVYLLHPPGGIAGGDSLQIELELGPHSEALITTPAATKCYRSAGDRAEVRQRLTVGAGATLEWLPQENLIFNGAHINFELTLDLAPSARLLAIESFGLGRPWSGEQFAAGRLQQSVQIRCADAVIGVPSAVGSPLLNERLSLDGAGPALTAPWGLGGASAFGALYAWPADAELLRWVQGRLPGSLWLADPTLEVAVTLIDRLLIVRGRSADLAPLAAALRAAWALLREPLLQRPPCPPRIWNT